MGNQKTNSTYMDLFSHFTYVFSLRVNVGNIPYLVLQCFNYCNYYTVQIKIVVFSNSTVSWFNFIFKSIIISRYWRKILNVFKNYTVVQLSTQKIQVEILKNYDGHQIIAVS